MLKDGTCFACAQALTLLTEVDNTTLYCLIHTDYVAEADSCKFFKNLTDMEEGELI